MLRLPRRKRISLWRRESCRKRSAGEEVFSGKGDEVPAGFHVLCGDTGDGKSAAQSQIHRKVSGGSGGTLPSGSDHIRHSGRAGVIVDQ